MIAEQTTFARLSARSQRQAMDWSLVLVSQGIETVIDQHDPVNGWGLLVAPNDEAAALAIIRQYRLENRHWPWRPQKLHKGLLFDWTSLAWVVLVAFFFWLDSRIDLQRTGLMEAPALSHGQWWRPFTAVWLHADLAHLAANATVGLVLLGLTMGCYGTGVGLLAAYLAGAGGNFAKWLFDASPHPS